MRLLTTYTPGNVKHEVIVVLYDLEMNVVSALVCSAHITVQSSVSGSVSCLLAGQV